MLRLQIGSLSNDDGDGNEDIKKAIGLLRLEKQRLCTCILLRARVLYIS